MIEEPTPENLATTKILLEYGADPNLYPTRLSANYYDFY